MKSGMRFLCFVIVCSLIAMISVPVFAEEAVPIKAQSAILMEASTGEILFEQNPNEHLPIASVTKVMTMLLIIEAINSGKITMQDKVTASEYACSMGGSQVFLEPGEQMSVFDMLKAIAVASGNDASVAMAEHIMGSAPAFVAAMNTRAKALGMNNTNFANCNGLDEDNHYSSAKDVAIMSRELLKHEEIKQFLSIWIDSLRDGKFGLANTNKLIRFYKGAIGIKTGSTGKAKYCLSAAATRDDLTLISVILAAPSTADRFGSASKLLDYGFANYAVVKGVTKGDSIGIVPITKGTEKGIEAVAKNDFKHLVPKGNAGKIEKQIILPETISAPVKENDKVGDLLLLINGKQIGTVDLIAKKSVNRITIGNVIVTLTKMWVQVK